MHTLIRDGRIVADEWALCEEVSEDARPPTRAVVPAAYVIAHPDALERGALGVWLDCDAEPDQLAPLLGSIPLIAIRFPAMNDGRGLSLAVMLRTRLGFRGELRAIGAVHEDLLQYMRRCGFDSFELPEGRDPATALAALQSPGDFYQGSVVDPLPAYRRIERGAGRL